MNEILNEIHYCVKHLAKISSPIIFTVYSKVRIITIQFYREEN